MQVHMQELGIWLNLLVARAYRVNEEGMIVDGENRRRLFHGVNAVEKLAPYVASFSEEDAELLQSLGHNVVRLGVLWEGTFPNARGVRNESYLTKVRETVDFLWKYNISTIIDTHQDVLSSENCGEGLPGWAFSLALEGFDREKMGFPYPLPFDDLKTNGCGSHSFFSYYLTTENQYAWTSLYESDVLATAFAEHWAAVAQYTIEAPGLLGYELLNEPFATLSKRHDRDLLGLYRAAYDTIRSMSSEKTPLIFFEPLVVDTYLSAFKKKSDFPYGGIDPRDPSHQVFAYHMYCPADDQGWPSNDKILCPLLVDAGWRWAKSSRKAMGVGGFLTEFGAVSDDDDSLSLLRSHLDHADKQFQSWTYWTYRSFDDITTINRDTESYFDGDGNLQVLKATVLARPFAPAVAGTVVKHLFDPDTSVFRLAFDSPPDLRGKKTIVHLPPLVYPSIDDLDIRVSHPNRSRWRLLPYSRLTVLELILLPGFDVSNRFVLTVSPRPTALSSLPTTGVGGRDRLLRRRPSTSSTL